MNQPGRARPPYLYAVLAALLVLAGYIYTLAPTVTFWDAGEFIAAARNLGIPHPPGTPLFVMLGHVWGQLLPLPEYAQRLNLLSATMSAAGAGFLFLVAQETLAGAGDGLEPSSGRVLAIAGALASALICGFTFTAWQNSNETEVYALATFTISAMCWVVLRWRAARGTARGAHLLLLVLYLAGLSIGNHLLALLAGPAVVAFLVATLWYQPAGSAEERAAEWGQAAVVAGTWALLIGTGLGSTPLMVFGGVCYLGAVVLAARSGGAAFAAVALAVALIGVTTYLFLYIRAGQHPVINEAAPDNFHSLLAVIRREQYPVRTPLDDPTVLHGADNPGRTLRMFGLQLLNYLQYFDWQWANGVTRTIAIGALAFPVRTLFTVLFFSLGLQGFLLQRRADRPAWWLLLMLWLVTGLGLMVYMNFKPGFSLAPGYALYPDPNDHEVRDRDYFFVVSYIVWGVWAGMGLVAAARKLLGRWRLNPALVLLPMAVVAVLPFLANFTAATRRHGADATLAADFAYDLLNSVPPYGILFTYGDNDTFPLWWAQEVGGIRRDVTVVCLALAETDWYKRQLRQMPIRPFDEASAPPIWRGRNPVQPTAPVLSMTDEQIEASVGQLLPQDIPIQIGPIHHVLARGTPLYSRDFAVLRILQENLGKRAIAWSITTGDAFYGLGGYVLQQGLALSLQATPVDTARADVANQRLLGSPLDIVTTEKLVWETYRYAGLVARGGDGLEPTAAGVARNLALPFVQLGYAHESRGNRPEAIRDLNQASRLSSSPTLQRALGAVLANDSGPR